MPFFDLKKRLAANLAAYWRQSEITAEALESEFGTPPQPALGHLALPCFKVAKLLEKPSDEVARDLALHFSADGVTVTATGPYANFKWNNYRLYRATLEAVLEDKDGYGSDNSGHNTTVVLEYCSPNIAKKLGFQHIRSTLLGNALSNIYEFLGYRTERINFVGDWGSQLARLLVGFEKWGDRNKLSVRQSGAAMDHLTDVYAKFHKELETHPELGELATKALQRLESGEPKASELWTEIRAASLAAMENTLRQLNVRFTHLEGESAYLTGMPKTLQDVKAKAGAHLSEGAWIIDVPGIATPALVQKKDGTTLYLTRDIAAAIDREKRFRFHKMLYIVAEQQRLHFQLLFGVLKMMGFSWASQCEHVSLGTVLFGSEKMSTREGRSIFLDDLIAEAKQLALEECSKKNPELPDKEKVAEQIGVGAIIFGNLSAHRKSDIEFKWENVIALDGENGPYVQYASVRCQSLIEKARAKGESYPVLSEDSFSELCLEEEILLVTLAKFGNTLHAVLRDNEPYHLTNYLVDLAKAFNRLYYKFPVLQSADDNQRKLRLGLVAGTSQVLQTGLKLLGISIPKEM